MTWIAPYQFSQKLPFDVDYKVMNTFLEFYLSLLRFVNYKLFTDVGLEYPPRADAYNDDLMNISVVEKL